MSARRRSKPIVHVLGGGLWQLPTIRAARTMGFETLVTDVYPERPAYAIADHHVVVDVTDVEGTLEVSRHYGIDGIVCDTTDVGVPTMAVVAETLGLPGIGSDTALGFTRKDLARETANDVLERTVRCTTVRDVRDATAAATRIGSKVVVKPVDNQSSRGVTIVESGEDLEAAVRRALSASRAGVALIEEFLPGFEITVESVMLDGAHRVTGISRKHPFPHRREVARRLDYPADLAPDLRRAIVRGHEALVRRLGMDRFGVTHAEYKVDGEDVALVEIAARGGGNRIHSDIVPALSGIDVVRTHLSAVTGRPRWYSHRPRHGAATLEFLDLPSGRVRSVRGLERARAIPGVHELTLEFAAGDTLEAATDDRSRAGFAVLFGCDHSAIRRTSHALARTLVVETEIPEHRLAVE